MLKAVEWPLFSRRTDFHKPLSANASGKVIRKFTSGFDAELANELYFFTSEADYLHPMCLLVPPSLVDSVEEGDLVNFKPGCLQIKEFELVETTAVEVAAFPEIEDSEILKQNCLALHANLKLFAQPSIVLSMISGCKTEENVLSGAQRLLLEDNLDFNLLAAYIGMGDGLTPAFDDFFSGMLFIDRFYKINKLHLPAGFIATLSAQTTRQALQQIQLADAGALSLRFERFFARMAAMPVRAHEIVKLFEHGHSSGADILCGVWFYLTQKVRM